MQTPFTLRSKLPTAGISIFAQMTALANECGAVNLAQGFPDFPPPVALQEGVSAAMLAGHNQYAPMPGVPALRQAIAQKVLHTYGADVNWETEVTVTPGAMQSENTPPIALLLLLYPLT